MTIEKFRGSALLGLLMIAASQLFALSAKDYSSSYHDLPFESQAPSLPDIPATAVHLSDFGAKGDGVQICTRAFESAIRRLSELGGGHLIVDRGVWLTGPIRLRSNIDLHLEKDAIVLFSPEKSDFPIIPADQGTKATMRQPPIYALDISNFSITGEGVLDGNGEYWRPYKRFKVSDAEWKKLQRLQLKPSELYGSNVFYPMLTDPGDGREEKRARLIRVVGCRNFLIEGITVQNSPSFHVNVVMSRDFVIDGIMVRCPWNAQNGDGIDLSSCQDALLTGCSVDCGDDAICLKSGIGEEGRRRGPCKNILIEGCTVFHGHGGFVIGSDTSGGMENIMVRNCRMMDTDVGLRFKSGRDRGGLIRNVFVEGVVMCDIAEEAILFDCYYGLKPGDISNADPADMTPDTPRFEHIRISDIICRDAGAAIVCNGLPEMPVKDVEISNSVFTARKGLELHHCEAFATPGLQLCESRK